MTRIVVAAIVGVLAALPAYAECTRADRTALEEFDQAWGKATRSGDRATLEQVLADDYAGFGAAMTTKSQTIANAVRAAEQRRDNQTIADVREDFYQINCTPTTATVVHRTVTTTGRGSDERVTYGRSIHVLEKRGGKWLAVSNTGHALNDSAIIGYLELEWNEAQKNKDVAWYERNLASEYSGVWSEDPQVMSKAGEITFARTDKRMLDSIDLSELVVRVVGDTATVTGLNHLKGRDAQGRPLDRRVRFTDTFVKRNGRWLALASQGSVIPAKTGT